MVLTLSEAVLLVQSSALVLIAENSPILEKETELYCVMVVIFMVDFLAWVELRYSWSGKLVMSFFSSCNGFRFFMRSLSLKQVCYNTYSATRNGKSGRCLLSVLMWFSKLLPNKVTGFISLIPFLCFFTGP